MNRADEIYELYWIKGKLKEAVELKEKSLVEGCLSKDDKQRLKKIPDTLEGLYWQESPDPPAERIGFHARRLCECLEKVGIGDTEVLQRSGLSKGELDLARSGHLRKRPMYKRLWEAFVLAALQRMPPEQRRQIVEQLLSEEQEA